MIWQRITTLDGSPAWYSGRIGEPGTHYIFPTDDGQFCAERGVNFPTLENAKLWLTITRA